MAKFGSYSRSVENKKILEDEAKSEGFNNSQELKHYSVADHSVDMRFDVSPEDVELVMPYILILEKHCKDQDNEDSTFDYQLIEQTLRQIPGHCHRAAVQMLIDHDMDWIISRYWKIFTAIDPVEYFSIMKMLFSNEQTALDVVSNDSFLENIQPDQYLPAIELYLKKGFYSDLLSRDVWLLSVTEEEQKKIAHELAIRSEYLLELFLEKVPTIDTPGFRGDLAVALVSDKREEVFHNTIIFGSFFQSIPKSYHRKIVNVILEGKNKIFKHNLCKNLNLFTDLTTDEHKKIFDVIVAEYAWLIWTNMGNFKNISSDDYSLIAKLMILQGDIGILQNNILNPLKQPNFKGLDPAIAHLIKKEYPYKLAENIRMFPDIDDEFMLSLPRDSLMNNFEENASVFSISVLREVITHNPEHIFIISKGLHRCSRISPKDQRDLIWFLIKEKKSFGFMSDIDKFSGISPEDQHDIFEYIMYPKNSEPVDVSGIVSIAYNLEKLSAISLADRRRFMERMLAVADAMGDANVFSAFAYNINKFHLDNHQEIVERMLLSADTTGSFIPYFAVGRNIDKFQNLTPDTLCRIAQRIVQSSKSRDSSTHIDSLLNRYAIFTKDITVEQHLAIFQTFVQNLEIKFILRLIGELKVFSSRDEELKTRILEILFDAPVGKISSKDLKIFCSELEIESDLIIERSDVIRNKFIRWGSRFFVNNLDFKPQDFLVDIYQPPYKIFFLYKTLPKAKEIRQYIFDHPEAESILLSKSTEIERYWASLEIAREHLWDNEIKESFDALSRVLGSPQKVRQYLDIALEGNISIHDALYFVSRLVQEFGVEYESHVRSIFSSILTPHDIQLLASSAFTYSHSRAMELTDGHPPTDIRSFIRLCILIKKNFRYPSNISKIVKDKIDSVIDGVQNTEKLTKDLQSKDDFIVAMLENRFGWDEKALIQPTPEIIVHIKPLGPMIRATLDRKNLDKLNQAIGKMQDKKLGFSPLLLDIQKEALFLEENRLRSVYADFYKRDPQDKELIKIKKEHKEYLDSLKIIAHEHTGKIAPDVSKTGGRVSRLVEKIAEYKNLDSQEILDFQFQNAQKLYSVFSRLITADTLPGGFQTNYLLSTLIEKVQDAEVDLDILQRKPYESQQVFQDRFVRYVDSVLDEYFHLANFISQQSVHMKHLEPVMKKVISEDPELISQRVSYEKFLKDPDVWLEKNHVLRDKITNIYEQYDIPLGEVLFARVCAKSDPETMIAGDETQCCMAYGTDKHYEYMFRPDTAIFVVGVRSMEGEKIIAQSVLVAANEGERGNRDTRYDQMWNTLPIQYSTIAFDNIEVRKSWQNENLGHIANVYMKAINTLFPDKTIILGTTYNDDRDLVSSQGMYVKNVFCEAINTALSYSDCFGDSDCYKMRGPIGEVHAEQSIRLARLTSDGFGETSPIRAQIKSSFQLSEDDLSQCRFLLSATQNRIGNFDDGDPIFEARSVSVQIHKANKPVLLLLALDYGNDFSDNDFDTVAIEKYVVGGDDVEPGEIRAAIIEFLLTQEQDGYRIKIPTALLEVAHTNPDSIKNELGYDYWVAEEDLIYFYGNREVEDEE